MTTMTKVADETLREAVWTQLERDPQIDAAMVGVTAHEGVVTLTGHVRSYPQKLAAERSALQVHGVRAVANDLDVKLVVDRDDSDIAHDALDALRRREGVPATIQVAVRHGHITLKGIVDWHYQRVAAERAVRYLKGVRGVVNNVAVTPTISEVHVQKNIVAALHRAADVDARKVHVIADGSKVVLTGAVRSWNERQQAETAAWCSNGVTEVDNQITVVPQQYVACGPRFGCGLYPAPPHAARSA